MVLKPMKLSQLMISRRRKKNTKTKADRERLRKKLLVL